MDFLKKTPLQDLSIKFALRIIKLHDYLKNEKGDFTISRQLLRSGTSIGANIAEAQGCQSDADFIAKLHISLKESRETEYWLYLLVESGRITQEEYISISSNLNSIISLLVTTLKSTKARISKLNP